jgi:hypothetical protein
MTTKPSDTDARPGREPAETHLRLTQAKQRELIRATLVKDPTLPDLRIARVIGCAVTTVARVREAVGVVPYRRHRDRRQSAAAQVTKEQLLEQIAAVTSELARERRRRIAAEQALAADGSSPLVTRAAPVSPPPSAASAVPSPPRDPAMSIPAQVPNHGRGLPAAVSCEVCGDTRYWTDCDMRVWRCAGCHPPGPGQLLYKSGRWP